MTPLRIYLADLTHMGSGRVATEAFPLNIGLIASYAKKVYGKDIDLRLFKFPDELQEALIDKPPQILGLSNYVWNSNLSYRFCEMAKAIDRDIVTVFGGTNYPFDAKNQEAFLRKRPALDCHVFYEGEAAFSQIVFSLLSMKANWSYHDIVGLKGHQRIDLNGRFLNGGQWDRIKDLDSIPSPYSTGLLDKFFAQGFTPLLETARGCPFKCNFCNAGDGYFTKVNKFSDEYVREEFTYVAKKCKEFGITHMTLADNNFGMIPRDRQTAELLYELQKDYGWPQTINAWTGKNAKERVIDITRVLGSSFSISMSVQSLDPGVLENIERDNIRISDYQAIAGELNAQGRPQHAEVIMPLPGETYPSHIAGLNQLLDTGVSRVFSHTLQCLHGTPYKDDENYREKWGLKTKWRLVPLDFSQIDGVPVLDVEEVVVATNTFSFESYIGARFHAFLIDLCHNSEVFRPLQEYLAEWGISNSDWIENIRSAVLMRSQKVNQVIGSFIDETQSELWDSERELMDFYAAPEHYARLVNGEAGTNLLFKHRLMMFSQARIEWIDFVFKATRRLLMYDFDRLAELQAQIIKDSEWLESPTRSINDHIQLLRRNAGREPITSSAPGWSASG